MAWAIDEPQTATIAARTKANHTRLRLQAGATYRFEATGEWQDRQITCGPSGYASPAWYFRLVERWRRLPKAPWFALVGQMGPSGEPFLIGSGRELALSTAEELLCFANDLPFLYWNNSGTVSLTVTQIA